jgi:hypothetical protein
MDATPGVWATIAAFCVLAGWTMVVGSEPVYRLVSPVFRRHVVWATLLVFVVGGALSATAFEWMYKRELRHAVESTTERLDPASIPLPGDAIFLR